MPIYEYRCDSCQDHFEKLVFTRTASVSCPRCGGGDVTRRPSTFGTAGVERQTSSGCSGCSAGSCSGCSGH